MVDERYCLSYIQSIVQEVHMYREQDTLKSPGYQCPSPPMMGFTLGNIWYVYVYVYIYIYVDICIDLP